LLSNEGGGNLEASLEDCPCREWKPTVMKFSGSPIIPACIPMIQFWGHHGALLLT
jgi:hypothetical protein